MDAAGRLKMLRKHRTPGNTADISIAPAIKDLRTEYSKSMRALQMWGREILDAIPAAYLVGARPTIRRGVLTIHASGKPMAYRIACLLACNGTKSKIIARSKGKIKDIRVT